MGIGGLCIAINVGGCSAEDAPEDPQVSPSAQSGTQGSATTSSGSGASDGTTSSDATRPVPTEPEAIATGAPPVDGQVNDYWSNYCVATFTRDHVVTVGQIELFTVHEGERLLMFDFDESPIGAQARLAHLAPEGPYEFYVETPGTSGTAADLPLTSNCAPEEVTGYWATFADTTVYTTADMTEVLCKLAAGRAQPVGTKLPLAFSVSEESFPEGPAPMKVSLLGYEADCNNAETGFLMAPEVTVRDTVRTHLIPFGRVAGPKP